MGSGIGTMIQELIGWKTNTQYEAEQPLSPGSKRDYPGREAI